MLVGGFYETVGELDEARAILEDAHAVAARVMGPTHVLTLECGTFLAVVLARMDEAAAAADLLERASAFAGMRFTRAGDTWRRAAGELTAAYARAGDDAAAERWRGAAVEPGAVEAAAPR